MKKDKIIISSLSFITIMLFISFCLRQCGKKGPLDGLSFAGAYKTCEYIELSFYGTNKVSARITSTDFVGGCSSDKIKGRYKYKAPYILIEWKDSMDMTYIEYDSLEQRMIMYGANDTYYLSNKPEEGKLTPVNHWLYFNETVVLEDNDYAIVEHDSLINGYGTDAQRLRLPKGYSLTYDQIMKRQIQKIGGLEKGGILPITFGLENKLLQYEDDTLKIVFSRICFQTEGDNKLIKMRDYSVVPLIVYDKRKH